MSKTCFVEKTAGSGEVYRVLPDERDAYLDAPVYATAEPVHHNPISAEASGPYAKGEALEMTLGEIAVRFQRDGEAGLRGEVTLPEGLTGTLEWNGKAVPLEGRTQTIVL